MSLQGLGSYSALERTSKNEERKAASQDSVGSSFHVDLRHWQLYLQICFSSLAFSGSFANIYCISRLPMGTEGSALSVDIYQQFILWGQVPGPVIKSGFWKCSILSYRRMGHKRTLPLKLMGGGCVPLYPINFSLRQLVGPFLLVKTAGISMLSNIPFLQCHD